MSNKSFKTGDVLVNKNGIVGTFFAYDPKDPDWVCVRRRDGKGHDGNGHVENPEHFHDLYFFLVDTTKKLNKRKVV